MEYLKLIGIAIIVLGFALKFDVLATVLLAGLVTGIVAGMDIPHILSILGESFVSNRLMSIFLIIFPVIAIIERYGLKERAAYLIGKIKMHLQVRCWPFIWWCVRLPVHSMCESEDMCSLSVH